MSESNNAQDTPEKKGAATPAYPRSWVGWVVWIGFATALMLYVSLWSVYRSAKRFKIESRKTAVTEARTTIAKLHKAQEAYRAKHGVYLATTLKGEGDFYPAPDPEPRRRRFLPRTDGRTAWAQLRSAMPKVRMYCGYVIVAGPAGSLAKAGPRGKALFDNRPPKAPWFYVRAECIQGEGKILHFESSSASKKILLRE